MAETPPVDKLESRIRYYLLDFEDKNMDLVEEQFGKLSLREFTTDELHQLFSLATTKDSPSITRV